MIVSILRPALVALLAFLSGCSGRSEADNQVRSEPATKPLPERQRALTISGANSAVHDLVRELTSRPHSWTALPGPTGGGVTSIRLRWDAEPDFRDLGGIIYLAQKKGLTISDTDLIERER
jgi:hypothetical protein